MDLLNLVWRDLHNPRIWARAPKLAQDIYKDHYARYRQIFHRTRRFKIDDKALRVAVELSLEGPEKMAQRLFMARLPFPEVWIEFDLHEKLRIGKELGISPGVDESTPERIGYLLREDPGDPLRWSCITWVSVDGIKEPAHAPHRGEMLSSMAMNAWLVDTAMRAPPERIGDVNGVPYADLRQNLAVTLMNGDEATTEDAIRAFAHLGWGYGSALSDKDDPRYQGVDPMRMLGEAKPLSNSINVGWEPMSFQIRPIASENMEKTLIQSCIESRGDVRLIASLLSLVNEVPIVETPAEQKGAFTGAGGVIKKYLTNKIVTINIPAKRPIGQVRKILARKVKSHKARHEVRGHWRTIVHKEDHWRKTTMPDGTIERVFIAKGQLERVWVKNHERGDAAYGYVKHDYQVEKSGR